MTEEKVARVCWNTNGWTKPSGKNGKSKNKKLFEFFRGYGHEEWLLDTSKLINGWHYGYMQPIGKNREKYIGKKFNISLYTINGKTKERWWIGRIRDVVITTPKESTEIYKIYKKNGWFEEMRSQLKAVGVPTTGFPHMGGKYFASIKYNLGALELLNQPLRFSFGDPAVGSNYYVLLNKIGTPRFLVPHEFSFSAGHKSREKNSLSNHQEQTTTNDLIQNSIQDCMYEQLSKAFGKKNVGSEQRTANGSKVDLVVKIGNSFRFYELKTGKSDRYCIRQSLAQLLEYAYYAEPISIEKLIIVSINRITSESRRYLKVIRAKFRIPIYYQVFDYERKRLLEELH